MNNDPASWTSDLSVSAARPGIDRPNHVWCADMTYIPMRRGFHYLIAIMDWSTRKVLSWRVSNTMDGEFCIEALEEALARFGCPEIFNTDPGKPVHLTALHRCVGESRRTHLDGRPWALDGQRIQRAALAQPEV
jgi:putative transposase